MQPFSQRKLQRSLGDSFLTSYSHPAVKYLPLARLTLPRQHLIWGAELITLPISL
jgi:hypothetical protein